MVPDSKGYRTQATKEGSYASDDTHLFGFKDTADKTSSVVTSHYCMKTAYDTSSDFEWQKGCLILGSSKSFH